MSDNNLDEDLSKFDDEARVKLSKGKLVFSVVVLYLLFATDFIVRVGINSIFPLIQEDLLLSDAQVGLIASTVLFGMAAFVLPISYLAEKFSKKKAIVGMALIWSLGSLLGGFAKSFPALLISRFSVGVGNASYAPASTAMLTSWFGRAQWGKAVGLYNTSMTVGMSGGAILYATAAVQFGWRGAVIALSLFSLTVAILSFFLPEAEGDGGKGVKKVMDERVSVKKAVIVIIKNKSLLLISVFYGFATMIAYTFTAWFPIYCVRVLGMTIPQAAGLAAIITLIATIGYPIGGAILDKWYAIDRRARVWFPGLIFALVGILYATGFAFKLIPVIAIGRIVWTMGPTCVHSSSQELVPYWFKAVAYGIVVVFIQGFGALGPLFTGILSDTFGIQKSIVGVQSLMLVSSLGFLWASFSYLKNYDESRRIELEDERLTGAKI